MAYIKCNACPSPGDCEEAGRCLNTFVTHSHIHIHRGNVSSVAQPLAAIPSPSPAKAPPSAPRAPGQGSVTEQIFAACDATLAQMWPDYKAQGDAVAKQRLDAARKQAVPQLVQAGVNINSARKGSSMWIQARA